MGVLGPTLPALVTAAWLTWATVATIGVWYYQRAFQRPIRLRGNARAVVILPIRGLSDNLPRLWTALCAQSYASWRVIFVVESSSDPAHDVIAGLLARETGGPSGQIVIAGAAADTGQKVHNQLAALNALRADDEVVVFADADILPPADWLARLVHPLRDPAVAVVAGHRWLSPEDRRLATAFACLVSAAIVTLPRFRIWNLAWGGSMALRRSALEAIDLKGWWRGSLNDDLQLTRAVRSHGKSVLSPTALLLASPVTFGWRQAIAFGRRQYLQIRIYAPRHWLAGVGVTALPILGWIVAIPRAARGDPVSVGALILACALHQWRATMRHRIACGITGERRPRQRLLFDRWAAPICLVIHAAMIWSTMFGRKIVWRGRTYRIDGPQRVGIVKEPAGRLTRRAKPGSADAPRSPSSSNKRGSA